MVFMMLIPRDIRNVVRHTRELMEFPETLRCWLFVAFAQPGVAKVLYRSWRPDGTQAEQLDLGAYVPSGIVTEETVQDWVEWLRKPSQDYFDRHSGAGASTSDWKDVPYFKAMFYRSGRVVWQGWDREDLYRYPCEIWRWKS